MEAPLNFLTEALKAAQRSNLRRYKNGAVIVSKGKIVSRGTSHTPHLILFNLLSLHSEIHALWNAKHLNLSGSSIYIAAVSGKSGNVTLGRPCINCSLALQSAGIEDIYYTVPGGEFIRLDISEELKDYSITNNFGKSTWEPPDWAINKRRGTKWKSASL